MAKTLTASDRSALIRLASSMEKGSEERKAILAGLSKVAAVSLDDLYAIKWNIEPKSWGGVSKTYKGHLPKGLKTYKEKDLGEGPRSNFKSNMPQFFVVKVDGDKYLVNTEGYNYARHVVRLASTLSKGSQER